MFLVWQFRSKIVAEYPTVVLFANRTVLLAALKKRIYLLRPGNTELDSDYSFLALPAETQTCVCNFPL